MVLLRYYSVKRYLKKSNSWTDISYYNENGSFLGPANSFTSKDEAQKYLEVYQNRMNKRVNTYGKFLTQTENGKLRLKVFEIKEEDKYKKW
jgi:hypothetical protein